MKKNVFLLLILTTTMMISCDKEIQQNSNNPIDIRTDDPNFLEFETDLNDEYVANQGVVAIPIYSTISFTHTNGFITTTEKNRIINLIEAEINSGFVPKFIDVNINRNEVILAKSAGSLGNPTFPNDLQANGGINTQNQLQAGNWCDNSIDGSGGGCGRVASKYWNSLPNYSFGSRFVDIREIGVIGGCNFSLDDQWSSSGLIEVTTPDFYIYDAVNCHGSSHNLCMSSSDLQSNYDELVNAINTYLPDTHEVIGIRNCFRYRFPLGNNQFRDYWYFAYNVAQVVN